MCRVSMMDTAVLAGSPVWLTGRALVWPRRLPVMRPEAISAYFCSSELARSIDSRARMRRIVGAAPGLGRSGPRRCRDFHRWPEQLPRRTGTPAVRARSHSTRRKRLRPTRSTSTIEKRGGVRRNRPVEVRRPARHSGSVGPRHRRPVWARREHASPRSMPGPSAADPPAATPVRGRWRPATGGPRRRCGSPGARSPCRAPGPGRSTAARRSARGTRRRPGRRCRSAAPAHRPREYCSSGAYPCVRTWVCVRSPGGHARGAEVDQYRRSVRRADHDVRGL